MLYYDYEIYTQISDSVLSAQCFSSIGDSLVQEVFGAVSDSVTFSLHVPDSGTIIYKGETVGLVLNSQSEINGEKFVNRLRCHNQSGFFTLSDLRPDDSGLYTVESTKVQKGKQEYHLDMYKRVSAPQVINTTNSSSEFCLLLCSVRNVRGLTLVWSEGHGLLYQTISISTSNTTLSLYLEVIFSCVASNPVSNETTTIDVTKVCPLDKGLEARVWSVMFITVVYVVISNVWSLMIIVIVAFLRKRKESESSWCAEDSYLEYPCSVTPSCTIHTITHLEPSTLVILESWPGFEPATSQ
ncbi:uncharacterized protein LOC132858066 [Tachysurus vachellii]|uniref:uncharacterized protein LOC132858066 n=1 Tax=Tachysurus vachellii TaxID=175792 RepID=UPI00296AA7D3|nr:uncharacterized protein LOC132858066 [Tachysurus vachellii]